VVFGILSPNLHPGFGTGDLHRDHILDDDQHVEFSTGLRDFLEQDSDRRFEFVRRRTVIDLIGKTGLNGPPSLVASIMVDEGRRLLATKEYVGLQYQAKGQVKLADFPRLYVYPCIYTV